jgi:hypothetical protein
MTSRSQTAAKVALDKEKHPERFCPVKRCLWRTGGGFCPRHQPTGKCYELALAFLGDHPAINTDQMADELAMEIQECIECFIAGKEKASLLEWCRKAQI